MDFLGGSVVKKLPANARRCRLDPLEEEIATHSSILAWRIPWVEEPDGLQSLASQRVGHNWACMHAPQ